MLASSSVPLVLPAGVFLTCQCAEPWHRSTFSSGITLRVPRCCQCLRLQGSTAQQDQLVCTVVQPELWHTQLDASRANTTHTAAS